MNIFLTKPEEDYILKDNDCFLGRWCLGDRLKYFNTYKHKIVDYHWCDHRKVDNDYDYLFNLYYKLLKHLKVKLNTLHNENRSERFWHIIIGAWLYKFLILSFDKWECINNALKSYHITNIYHYEFDLKKITPSDITDLHELGNNDFWNNNFFYLVAKNQIKKNINFKKVAINNNILNEKFLLNKYTPQSTLIIKLIDKFLRIQEKPNIVLYKSYFRKDNNLKIYFQTKTIPRFYSEFEKQIQMPKPKNRSKITLDFVTNSDYENFVKENIFLFLPVSYLEGYKDIDHVVKKINISPKYIISAVGEGNDLFSFWAANKIEKNGSKYFYSEHGGYTENCPKFDSYLKKYDFYLSWNHSSKKNVKQISPQFYFKSISKEKLIKGEKLYVILSSPNLYNHQLHYDVKSDQTIYEYEKLRYLKNLPREIYDNLKFRMHPNNSHRWQMKERIKDDFNLDKICTIKKIQKCFLKAKIILNMDFQTSFYQAMNSGKPNIIFTTRKFTSNIEPKIISLYKKFIEEKIIIMDQESLVNHLKRIWNDPIDWWNKDSIINLRKEFEFLCSRKSKNFEKDILKLF